MAHRVLFSVFRKRGHDREAFLSHYREVHIPIASTFPRLIDYQIFPVTDVDGCEGGSPDAFAIMTFASAEEFSEAVANPEFARAVEDNESFVDHFETYSSTGSASWTAVISRSEGCMAPR